MQPTVATSASAAAAPDPFYVNPSLTDERQFHPSPSLFSPPLSFLMHHIIIVVRMRQSATNIKMWKNNVSSNFLLITCGCNAEKFSIFLLLLLSSTSITEHRTYCTNIFINHKTNNKSQEQQQVAPLPVQE